MRRKTRLLSGAFLSACMFCTAAASAQSGAENGKLKIQVSPKQAYVFVDGKAIRDGSQTIDLGAGKHEVGVYNYGYLPKVQEVAIGAGETTRLNVALQSSGDEVTGPFADIEIKGDPRAAVFLNGDTPDYFVGHVDEFDWDWIWHQRLLVHQGTYHLTVTREGNTIWSGDVTAKAGQHITIYLGKNGEMKTKEWTTGMEMQPQPRFRAGIASATVPIASAKAQLNAQSRDINCGESTELKWKSKDAVAVTISKLGSVPADGLRAVSPTKDTTYILTAKGPGGESEQSVTVNVDTEPKATLSLNEPEVHYHKIGDKVVEQDSATLNWSASNANSVMVQPFGGESMTGSETVTPQIEQTTDGPVKQDVNYTLTAANACGGTVTKTATLHVVGTIDPPPAINIASVFYPTNYPLPKHPRLGLVAAEQQTLGKLADHFQNYIQYDQDAKLKIVGHADVRGSKKYNQSLSERRAELTKDYLVAHGVSADRIETDALGKTQQLPPDKVKALLAKDSQPPEKWMTRKEKDTWLAFNRRVDIDLEPTGQKSAIAYPVDAPHARLLWARTEPSLKAVEAATKTASGTEQAEAEGMGK